MKRSSKHRAVFATEPTRPALAGRTYCVRPIVAHDEKGNMIGDVVHNGRPDKGMPALPLTDAQISDIAAFLHWRIKEGLSSSEVPEGYPAESC